MAAQGSSILRRVGAWIFGTLTVLLAPLAALFLCFSCSPGTDMQDAPYVLAAAVGFTVVASLTCVVCVILATPHGKRQSEDAPGDEAGD
jgi:hypothetical protein